MDNNMKRAMMLLLENKWLIRKKLPEEYNLVRRYEKELQRYFQDKCGWLLVSNQRFYKLEKIPARAEAFMGIKEFQQAEDYVLLCCIMAYLEEQEVDSKFLLSDLCEALLEYYPDEEFNDKINWESYNWRRALVRVINYLLSMEILRWIDGDRSGENFLSNDFSRESFSGETLYQITILSRYFLRSYPKDLQNYDDIASLYQSEFMENDAVEAEEVAHRRHNVYRQLLLSPIFYKETAADDFAYLRKMYRRINEEMMELFEVDVQLYDDCAMAVSNERNTWFKDVFPARLKGSHDVILSLAAYCWENSIKPQALSLNEFINLAEKTAQQFNSGWTKEFREMTAEKLSRVILAEMMEWQMVFWHEKENMVILQPALFKLIGKYPADYLAGGTTEDGK